MYQVSVGASDTGVTADTITITVMADTGSPLAPGLFQGPVDAVEGWVDWKNANGGPAPGGTCTNVGCIPSKAMLQSAEYFEHAQHGLVEHGVEVKGLKLNLAQMLLRKDGVVKQNNDGILYLFKKNKVSFFHGRGAFAKADGPQVCDKY